MNDVKHKLKLLHWSVGFSTYLYIHNFILFSLLSQFDILYHLKDIFQTSLSASAWKHISFSVKLQMISPESAVSDIVSSVLAPKAT